MGRNEEERLNNVSSSCETRRGKAKVGSGKKVVASSKVSTVVGTTSKSAGVVTFNPAVQSR
jgi:hypothetical protein